MSLGISAAGWAAVAAAGAGVYSASQNAKAAKKAASASSSSNQPWSPVQDNLLWGTSDRSLKPGVAATYDANGVQNNPDSDYNTVTTPGILGEANKLYGTTGMSQDQKDMLGSQANQMKYVIDNNIWDQLGAKGMSAINGNFDTNITQAQMADLAKARAGQGKLDPTGSMARLLSGNVDTSTLDPVVNNATQRLTQNFNEQVMPAIDGGAIMSGQFGGSRQGVAQGIASRGLAQSIGDMEANMYNNAFNTAQQNMYGTANALNQQAGQNSQFNSNLQLQNNNQTMQQAQNNLNNRVVGGNLLNGALNGMNATYQAANTAYDAARNAPWTDLSKYQSVVQPIAGLGNTTTQTNPYYTNTVGNILGGAATGAGIYKNLGFGNATTGSPSTNSGYNEWGYTGGSADASNTTGFNW